MHLTSIPLTDVYGNCLKCCQIILHGVGEVHEKINIQGKDGCRFQCEGNGLRLA